VNITPGDFLFGEAFFERYIVSFDFETQQVGFTRRLFRWFNKLETWIDKKLILL